MVEIPDPREITTARTEEKTEAAPLTPQSHGVNDSQRRDANFIPSGNAMTIKNPMGKMREGASGA